jgi:hypothetical protein
MAVLITQWVSGLISSVFSSAGMNSSGGIIPRFGVLPTNQRFDAVQFPRPHIDDRLVVQAELVVLDREPDRAPQPELAGAP